MGTDPVVSYASSDEARRRWREFLDAIQHKGEHVIIQRYIQPAAAVVPIEWYERAQQALANGKEKP